MADASGDSPLYDRAALKQASLSRRRWEATTLANWLARAPERQGRFETLSGLPVERLYTPEHVADLNYERDLGHPGEYPFTRGPYPTMYRGRIWTHRQIAGFGQAEDTNGRFKFLLAQGQTGLSIDFDQPTLTGFDSDDPMSMGEVGRVGVAIDTVEDMHRLFDGIPLDQISISMTINHPAPILYAMLLAVAEERGVPADKLSGTVQFDVLKEFIAQKTFVFPPHGAMRLVRDMLAFASSRTPRWNMINVSGYHIREAGSNAPQEIAFTLAAARAYVRAGLEAGLAVDEFAPRLSFFFNCQIDFIEEVAKFRAARRLWARIMKEEFHAQSPESMRLKFHCQTAGASLTAQQPMVNIVRVAVQALAAVLGGAQSLHTNGMDEALSIPSEEAMQIALRTQQVIAHESGVANFIDPLGGSFAVEALTNELEAQARAYLAEVDAQGGYVACVENGFFARQIAEASFNYQRSKESGERIVVGINRFVAEEEAPLPIQIQKADPAAEDRQVSRLKAVRAQRDAARAAACLERIRLAAAGDANLIPLILEAVKARVSEGEIIGALKSVFGSHVETPVF